MPTNDASVYNIVTLRNIDNEDFVFKVDKAQYVIPRGQTRNFPKFMAALAVKHLTDKLLLKEDTSGLSLMNDKKREEISAKIVVGEQNYEKPVVPTDEQVVEDMNRPSDLDRALTKNVSRLKENDKLIPEPKVAGSIPITEDGNIDYDKTELEAQEDEKFEGLESTEMPTREQMLNYAKDTLGMDFTTVIKAPGKNKGKSIQDIYNAMSDQELFNEFQLEGVAF